MRILLVEDDRQTAIDFDALQLWSDFLADFAPGLVAREPAMPEAARRDTIRAIRDAAVAPMDDAAVASLDRQLAEDHEIPGLLRALDARYVALDVESARLGDLLRALAETTEFLGLNVTVPHKIEVLHYLDELDESAGDEV